MNPELSFPTHGEIEPMMEGRQEWLPEFYETAFTDKQKEAIRQRDHYHCQFPGKHYCAGRLEVHHILPQRYCMALGIDQDFPENGLTICRNAHILIHPDIGQANGAYHTDHTVFQRVFEEREKKIADHEIYWDATWDRQLSALAIRNTQRAGKDGWEFPTNGKKAQ